MTPACKCHVPALVDHAGGRKELCGRIEVFGRVLRVLSVLCASRLPPAQELVDADSALAVGIHSLQCGINQRLVVAGLGQHAELDQ